jgi:hypothetical protein
VGETLNRASGLQGARRSVRIAALTATRALAALTACPRAYAACSNRFGGMLWFSLKTLSGSHRAFTWARRS